MSDNREHNWNCNFMGHCRCLRCGCEMYTVFGDLTKRSQNPCPGLLPAIKSTETTK
jgi:hypothetical protein